MNERGAGGHVDFKIVWTYGKTSWVYWKDVGDGAAGIKTGVLDEKVSYKCGEWEQGGRLTRRRKMQRTRRGDCLV